MSTLVEKVSGVFQEAQMSQEQGAAGMAHAWFPRLTPYAPKVMMRPIPNRPDVAGMFDKESNSVWINPEARTWESPDAKRRMAGLIALERVRGFLYSPLGEQFTKNFELTPEQNNFWDKFYLQSAGDAPSDPSERQRTIKSTILSRMLVGDSLPEGAPSLTPQQQQLGQLFGSYASGK